MHQSPGEPLRGTSGYEKPPIPAFVARSAPQAHSGAVMHQSPGEPLRGTSGYEKPPIPAFVARSAPQGALRAAMQQILVGLSRSCDAPESVDLEQFDVEDQGGVGRDRATGAGGTVAQAGRDGEAIFGAD
jgi:hypothetical protein